MYLHTWTTSYLICTATYLSCNGENLFFWIDFSDIQWQVYIDRSVNNCSGFHLRQTLSHNIALILQ